MLLTILRVELRVWYMLDKCSTIEKFPPATTVVSIKCTFFSHNIKLEVKKSSFGPGD